MTYQDTLTALRDDAAEQISAAWDRYEAGDLTDDQFAQLVAALILLASRRASTAAELAVTVEVLQATGKLTAPVGVVYRGHTQERFEDAAKTLLQAHKAGEDVTERLDRLARNAPLDAAQGSYGDALAKAPQGAWVRQMDADPCQLCQWWARGGQVWPKTHRMPRHKGCECVPRVVATDQPNGATP